MANFLTAESSHHAVGLLEKRLLEAAHWGDKELTRELLNHPGGVSIDSINQVGRTPLHVAAERGNWQVVRLLAEHDACLDACDSHGKTPLHVAAEAGHFWAAHYLLHAHSAPSMLLEMVDNSGQTPLHAAASAGSLQLLQQLLKFAAPELVDAADQVGRTPLMAASMTGQSSTVQLLLAHGANPDAVDKGGRTALHWAAYHNRVNVVKALLLGSANPEVIDKEGRTAAHAAAHLSHTSVLAELLVGGASASAVDRQNRTLLQAALSVGNQASVQLLQDHSTKPVRLAANIASTQRTAAQARVPAFAPRTVPRVFVFPAASVFHAGSRPPLESHGEGQQATAASTSALQKTSAPVQCIAEGVRNAPAAEPLAHSLVTSASEGGAKPNAQATHVPRRSMPASAFAGFCPPGMEAPPAAVSDSSSDADSSCHWTCTELSLPVNACFIEVELDLLPEGRRIGEGAFGVVYKCNWLGRMVAIKRFAGRGLSPSALRSFKTEVSTLSRLNHPNVVEFLGASVKPPQLGIVTEYVSNGSLFQLLHSTKHCVPIEPRRRLSIACDVAAALLYLHSCQPPIVHRDLKSANILISSDWTAKVADFGMSQLLRDAFLSARSQLGTSAWAAPEAFTNQDLCEKCDVFSFGVVLWELATGLVPWKGLSHHQITMAVAVNGLQLDIPMDVDPALACLMRDCWHLQPSCRPTFKEILARLQALPDIKVSMLTQPPLPGDTGTLATNTVVPLQTAGTCTPATPCASVGGPAHASDAQPHALAAAAATAPPVDTAAVKLQSAFATAACTTAAAAAATAAAARSMARQLQGTGWPGMWHQFTGHIASSIAAGPCLAKVSTASSAISRASISTINEDDNASVCTAAQPERLGILIWDSSTAPECIEKDTGMSSGIEAGKQMEAPLAAPSPLFIAGTLTDSTRTTDGVSKPRTSCCCLLWGCAAK